MFYLIFTIKFDIQTELERNIQESRDLTESRRDLKTALGETEGPLRVTKECLYKRKKRRVNISMECGYTLDTLITLYTLNNLTVCMIFICPARV